MNFSPEYKQTMDPNACQKGGEEGTLSTVGVILPACLRAEGKTISWGECGGPNGLPDVSGETEGAVVGALVRKWDSYSGVALVEGNPASQ